MSAQNPVLNIDIPVVLSEVKSVFSVAALSFEGDLPASLFHLGLIMDDISAWKAKSSVIVIFHTNAGHVTLADKIYNADRNISTGNPYKGLVQDMSKSFKHLRRTPHSHHPVEDSRGNAEAFLTLKEMGLKVGW